jgi:hypothetical protein
VLAPPDATPAPPVPPPRDCAKALFATPMDKVIKKLKLVIAARFIVCKNLPNFFWGIFIRIIEVKFQYPKDNNCHLNFLSLPLKDLNQLGM